METMQIDVVANWKPLEAVCAHEERPNFMHMGRVGTIELYKHRITRRYLNIDSATGEFLLYEPPGQFRAVERTVALEWCGLVSA